jgi:hypothetical protein
MIHEIIFMNMNLHDKKAFVKSLNILNWCAMK